MDGEAALPLTRRRVAVNDLAPIRELVGTIAARVGLARERANHLVLGVSEAVTNALTHGGGSPDVIIDLDPHRQQLVVRVEDHGPGMPHREVARPAPTEPHGRGLYLLHLLCDRVEIASTTAGTTIVLSMSIDAE